MVYSCGGLSIVDKERNIHNKYTAFLGAKRREKEKEEKEN